MRAYSLDLRVRVLAAFDAGLNYADVARQYTVSAEWVRILVRRRTLTGEVAARKPVSGRVPFHQRHAAELRAAIAEKPDLTLHQLRDRLQLDVSIGTLWNALQALKIRFKKKRSALRNNNDPMSSRNAPRSTTGNAKSSTRTGSFSSTKPGSKPT